MKIQEMAKYLAYADTDEDYVLIKKEGLQNLLKNILKLKK